MDADPAVVFAGIPISDRLVRWDPQTLGYISYFDLIPADFGPLKLGEGYWITLHQPTTITYQSYPDDAAKSISLALPGWHLIGQPHSRATEVTQCVLTGANAPAVCSVMPIYGWNPANLAYWEVGCDGAPINDSNLLEPWHGYWLCTQQPNLTLTIP